jgi:nitrate reductase beta subunit
VGRIRYIGLVLYDADAIEQTAMAPQDQLVMAQRSIIKDPFDPEVIAAAKANGIPDSKIDAAQKSPVYQFVKKWGLALPLHPEFRTLPMLFYVPPLGPVLAKVENGVYDNVASEARLGPLMSSLDRSRVPLRYMASLLAGGNEEIIRDVYRKLVAVRVYMRSKKVKDIPAEEVERALTAGKTNPAEVEAIWRLTSMPTFEERFVVPPMERETAVEDLFPVLDPVSRNYPVRKGAVGVGFHTDPARGP